MRILIVSNLFPPDYDGGQEINAWKIANALRERGHDVHVATSKFRPGFTLTEPEPDWIHRLFKFIPHVPDKKVGKAARLEIMKKLADRVMVGKPNSVAFGKLITAQPFDLVYCFGLHGIGLMTVAPTKKRGMPVLWHVGDHFIADHFAQPQKSRLYRFVLTVMLGPWFRTEQAVDYSHMAFVSRFLFDYFVEHDFQTEHPYIIPRGVDFPLGEDTYRARKAPPTFFMACRLEATKGVHVAIEAARLLMERKPDLEWRIEIAGGGDDAYVQELKQVIQRDGLEERVLFVGKLPRTEILTNLRSATAFLSCSLWGEPFANTIIETLGSGTPLIGAVAGSILEVVTPGVSALTYPKDDPTALADHMERILTDPELGHALAEAGLGVIRERYTLESIMEQTEEVFAKVVGSK